MPIEQVPWSRAGAVGLLVVAALGGACRREAADSDEDKPAAAAVTCKTAEAGTVEDTVDVTGVIAPPPRLDAIVSSPIAGRIGQVSVEEGDHVAAGALLAVVEDPALPAGSIEARAGVASAQAAKIAAELELARQQRLVDAGIGARKDLDDARAKAAAAAAELDAANARAGLAASQLARRELRAPRAGVVLHLWKRVGESVDAGAATPIAEIADVSILELHTQVPTSVMAKLSEKLTASVRVLGIPKVFSASVVRVAPAVDPATLLGGVRLAIDPKAEGMTAIPVGSAATGRIVIATRPGVIVPETALRRSLLGNDEVVVCDGSIARIASVRIGQRGERGVELTDGLKPGDRVVVDHVLGIEDGQALTAAGKPDGSKAADKAGGKDVKTAEDEPAGSAEDKKAFGKATEKADEATGKRTAKPGAEPPEGTSPTKSGAEPPAVVPADKAGVQRPAPAPPGKPGESDAHPPAGTGSGR
jgi:RND family efflux transporter MFP subunit